MNVWANSSHPCRSPQRAGVGYQNLTEGASAGLELNCEILLWPSQRWSNLIFQCSFHEQITFREQFWSSICPHCFAWKPGTQTPEMSLSCESWGRTCSEILGTKISIFLASVCDSAKTFLFTHMLQTSFLPLLPVSTGLSVAGGLLLSGKVQFLLLFPKHQPATIPPM